MKQSRNLFYLIAVVSLVVVAIVTTAIINAVKNSQSSPTDIRAKAGVANTLQLTGLVAGTNEAGDFIVNDVQFSENSRSGPARNYGTWTVTPPRTVSPGSIGIGQQINFTVDSASFDVLSKKVVASQLTAK
jgi:hypothetical protein